MWDPLFTLLTRSRTLYWQYLSKLGRARDRPLFTSHDIFGPCLVCISKILHNLIPIGLNCTSVQTENSSIPFFQSPEICRVHFLGNWICETFETSHSGADLWKKPSSYRRRTLSIDCVFLSGIQKQEHDLIRVVNVFVFDMFFPKVFAWGGGTRGELFEELLWSKSTFENTK
jgi:hypothetical protein